MEANAPAAATAAAAAEVVEHSPAQELAQLARSAGVSVGNSRMRKVRRTLLLALGLGLIRAGVDERDAVDGPLPVTFYDRPCAAGGARPARLPAARGRPLRPRWASELGERLGRTVVVGRGAGGQVLASRSQVGVLLGLGKAHRQRERGHEGQVVLVKCEDPALRAARLALLGRLREGFLRVADFSLAVGARPGPAGRKARRAGGGGVTAQ